jgi:hypothetical protein
MTSEEAVLLALILLAGIVGVGIGLGLVAHVAGRLARTEERGADG